LEVYADPCILLQELESTYAAGDVRRAESLFMRALEGDLPWDEVCAAAARGIAKHFGEQDGG
jgi:hypothetical protein